MTHNEIEGNATGEVRRTQETTKEITYFTIQGQKNWLRMLTPVLLATVVLFAAWAGVPAQAEDLFSTPMVCDTDNDNFFGGPGDTASGSARIRASGDLEAKIKGLPPGEIFSCDFDCKNFTNNGFIIRIDVCAVTDTNGKLVVDVEGFIPLNTGQGCTGGLLQMRDMGLSAPAPNGCVSGFGRIPDDF